MSKWINKDLFNKYVEKKEQEQDNQKTAVRKMENIWPTPAAGSNTTPEVYEGRFLPDPNNMFTEKFFYHFWKTGDKWNHVLCPKTWDINAYCPVCSITNKMYAGTPADKAVAGQLKRKIKHVANFYVISDPRDAKISEPEKKNVGKVKVYEFPDKVDAKIKTQLLDKDNGLGELIFEPGSEGYNFILRVKSTKPDKQNRTFPDYAESDFARKASAIGTDKQIKEIMESRYDLTDYIKSLETSEERIVEMLKADMLYSIIEDEWNKVRKISTRVEKEKEEKPVEQEKKVSEKKTKDDAPNFDDTDEDLLKELENMK